MAQLITVTFTSRPDESVQREPFQMQWRLRDHSLAHRFADALKIACDFENQTGYMYKRERFYNFPNGYFTRARVISLLQKHIATINKAYPGLVDHPVHQNMSPVQYEYVSVYNKVAGDNQLVKISKGEAKAAETFDVPAALYWIPGSK